MQRDNGFLSGRRSFLRLLAGATMLGVMAPLLGCGAKVEPLKVASNVFPGYEFLHLAASLGLLDAAQVKMLTMPSATACLQALAAGSIDGAALTLDEVLSAQADNMPLQVVAVLDVSLGVDVVLVQPEIQGVAQLAGRRIGVEQSAVGALMLAATLEQVGLQLQDVELVYATVDQHVELFKQRQVDALVTFSPVPQQLAGLGAVPVFDSRQIPDMIVDVLAVRPDAIARNPAAIRQLVAGQFGALQQWQTQPQTVAAQLASRLGIEMSQLEQAFEGMHLLGVEENRLWLQQPGGKMEKTLDALQQLMLKSQLLRHQIVLDNLFSADFLPD